MRKRKAYYRVFSLKDGTILMSLQSRKPSKSSLPRPRIDEDGVHRESPQKLEDFRHLEDWLKGSYHTTIATRLNTRRSIRELILPRIDAMEKQLASIQEKLARIESSRSAS